MSFWGPVSLLILPTSHPWKENSTLMAESDGSTNKVGSLVLVYLEFIRGPTLILKYNFFMTSGK